jgi:hypothetical protein
MKKLGCALAAAAALWFSLPTLAAESAAAAEHGIRSEATDVSAKRGHRMRHHRRHHDRGLHRGFSHSRHLGYGKH